VLAGEPDERLVALARDGDERAFGAIVERYRAPLLQYCRGFLPPSAAEDALQQTFINAHAALTRGGGRAPVALKPWLYRVAHNAALNVARDPQAGLARLTEDIDGVERPDEALVRSERFQRVVGAVRALPVKQRQVIVRHALEGDSHEQIAADLGLSAGAIRQLAHRARRTVRDAAAVLFPGPLLRWLPWGANAAETAAPAAGGAVVAKVAVAVVVAGVGGGAVEVATHRADRESRRADAAVRSDVRERAGRAPQRVLARPVVTAAMPVRSGELVRGDGTRSDGKDSSRSRDDSSGPGSSNDDSSGSGSSGSGSSGSGSSGSGSSGSGSSGSGSSGSDSSGSGSSGSDSSGSGSSGSGSSASGTSGSGSSGSGSSGSGSSGSGSGSSGSGSAPTTTLDSSGSGSSGSGSSGSGSGTTTLESDSSGSGSGPSDEELEDDSSGSGSGHG
jgi:RNA polymerase sigma factor (sigma-70 family)